MVSYFYYGIEWDDFIDFADYLVMHFFNIHQLFGFSAFLPDGIFKRVLVGKLKVKFIKKN